MESTESTTDVTIDGPPEVPRAAATSPMARVLPVVMVVAAAGMTLLYFSSGAGTRGPAMLLFPVMMAVSALGSVAYGMRGPRRAADLDAARRRYLRYLDAIDDMASRSSAEQHHRGHETHPEPAALWSLVGGPRTWERGGRDADFCRVRVGTGPGPASTRLIAPGAEPGDDADPFGVEVAARVIEHGSTVDDVPVLVDLAPHAWVRIEGDEEAARGLARAVLCHLAVFHHPDDVAVMAAVDGGAADVWDWLKWLPHSRGDATRMVVVDDGWSVPTGAAGVTVLQVRPGGTGLRVTLPNGDGVPVAVPDVMSIARALACARRVAAIDRGSPAVGGVGGWSDLIGIVDPTAVDVVRTWMPRSTSARLRVPIGVTDAGEPVNLDLKEAAHGGMGPHGLCVGATGSGKSELLRTLVLGLVTTHSPDALNLALIDFKGGATFHGFERLRHVAAVITNLADEAHLVVRMREALAGEMTRRQELLRSAGNFAGIADYDRARVEGRALAPLPVLLIVVDEFSELLAQQPDLAELFVAIGRLGRSLGMHLLLASQRLDEGRLRGLESHLSYRIALKTFSAAESRAVLGTADAHELSSTPGAAYLKTADGRLVGFSAAYVSDAVRRPRCAETVDVAPALFTGVRRSVAVAPPEPAAGTVLDAVVDRLCDFGRPAHRVWSPPLTASPALHELLDAAATLPALCVPIGLMDRPFDQRRDVLTAELGGTGGNVAIVGGPRSGKSTTMVTLALALAATHAPDDVTIYGLDFGGGTFADIVGLPHVGAVAGRFDVDLARRILGRTVATVRAREARLRSGTDPSDSDGADVFLMIDGWPAVRREVDGVDDVVAELVGQGLAVGVHVVLAAPRWADFRPAVKDQLGTRIELRLGDPAESEMNRARARLLTDRPAGRGLTRDGDELVIALPRLSEDGADAPMSAAAALLTARHDGHHAAPVRILPLRVDLDAVSGGPQRGVPLGIGDDDMGPLAIDFDDQPHLLILGEPGCGKTGVARTVCRGVARAGARHLVIVDPRRTLLDVIDGDGVRYATSADAARAHVTEVVDLLRSRLPGPEVTQRQLRDRSWWSGPTAWVVVDDYDLIAEGVSGNPLAALMDLLPHAADVGLRVVIARRSGGAARAMFDPVLARLRDLGSMGLMMSARPDEGPLFGSLRPTPQPPGRGTLIRRGTPDVLVQVAWSEPT